jgi:acetolactate synthase-1/2/3 large subunit
LRPGESFLPVLDALGDSRIDVVTAHHESSAGFMALADGRLTGRPGICLVSRGPGATNAAIAVHTADQDGVPMILLVGQVARKNLRRGSFQEIDYASMFGSMTRFVVEVSDPGRLPEAMTRAWHAAVDGTPGPVVVSMPEDMLEEMVEPVDVRPYRRTRTHPDPEAVDDAAALLADAARPVIIAGGALASEAGRAALLRLAEKWSLPVVLSFRRLDLFPNDHPLYAGDLGVFNTPEQMQALEESDAILAVGTRLGDLTTHGYTFPEFPGRGRGWSMSMTIPR